MKMPRILLLASVAVLGGALLTLQPENIQPAKANTLVLCAPRASGAGAGPRRITNPGTSGGSYVLDGNGCAPVSTSNSDAAYFQAQGYTPGPLFKSYVFVTGVLTGTTPVQMPSLPASTFIREIIVQNTTSNAVTGGIDIGKTSGAADVVSALTCGASCVTFTGDAALLLRTFSTTAQQSLFVLGHTAGNSANLTITVVYGYF